MDIKRLMDLAVTGAYATGAVFRQRTEYQDQCAHSQRAQAHCRWQEEIVGKGGSIIGQKNKHQG